MPTYRLQCSFGADINLPRHRMVFNPVFDDQGSFSDPQGLCDDLAAALAAWVVNAREVHVKAYDVRGTKPVYPAGDAILNANTCPASLCPRETALCLSFYNEHPRPRQRGRIYVPAGICGISVSAARPSATSQQKIADLVPILTGLGGVDVDWGIWSVRDSTFRKATNWWVDDEWDTIRSRGLGPSARLTGTTGE